MIPDSAFRLTTSCTYVCPSLVTYVAQSWKELVLIDSLTARPALDFLTNPTRVLLVFCSFSGSVFFSAFGIFFQLLELLGFAASFLSQQSALFGQNNISISNTGPLKVNLDGDTED